MEAQLDKLNKYAVYQKYNIVNVYRDDGFSAATTNRPALLKLIDDIAIGLIDIVIVYKLDRLSRNVRDVISLVEIFDKHNVILFSLTENIDVSSSFGRAALKMSATFSELERETFMERSKLGKEERAKQGLMSGSGKNSPYGYKLNKQTKQFDIVPEEAEAVKQLFDLYIQGYSFRKLHNYAIANIPGYTITDSMSLKRIIERPTYAGYFMYKGELYKGTNFQPILSYETYLQAQEQVKRNYTKRQHDNSPYLLTGLVICAKCGYRYVGKLSKNSFTPSSGITKYRQQNYYGCAARIKFENNKGYNKCNNTIFNASELEQMVENIVKNYDFSKYEAGNGSSGIIDKLMTENVNIKKQIDKLLELYINEIIDKATYIEKVSKLEKSITKNMDIISSQSATVAASPSISIEKLRQLQSEYDTIDRRTKRMFLGELIKYIAIDGKDVKIKWRVIP